MVAVQMYYIVMRFLCAANEKAAKKNAKQKVFVYVSVAHIIYPNNHPNPQGELGRECEY